MKFKLYMCLFLIVFSNDCNARVRILNEQVEYERIAKEYEAVIAGKMLKQMNEDIKPNALMGGGNTEAIYRDLMIDEYGKEVARKGDFGLAKSIKRDTLKSEGK